MISLIMSTYNGEEYIERQLESIRDQTVLPDEVIIIDDCSSDETVNIIDSFIHTYDLDWKLKVNSKNIGYKENYYLGMLEAKGDFIFLADQDDIWKNKKIEIMMEAIKADPQIWSLNCGVELIDSKDRPISMRHERKWQNAGFLYAPLALCKLTFYNFRYVLLHNLSPGCTQLIDKRTRDVFIRTYQKDLPHDWYLNMIASANGGCAFINECLVCYRCHGSNVIGADSGLLKGIRTRSREYRLADYQSRIEACRRICSYYGMRSPDVSVLQDMVSFYNNPTPLKLVLLWKTPGYMELSKHKVKLWELLVAFRIDRLFRILVRD